MYIRDRLCYHFHQYAYQQVEPRWAAQAPAKSHLPIAPRLINRMTQRGLPGGEIHGQLV